MGTFQQKIRIKTRPDVACTCHSNKFCKILVIVNCLELFYLFLQVTTLLWVTLTLIKCVSLVWNIILTVFCGTPGLCFILKKKPQSGTFFQSLLMIVSVEFFYINYNHIKQFQFLLVCYSSIICFTFVTFCGFWIRSICKFGH